MRIEKIKVNNFKSLIDFEMPLSQFNCLVGLNSSGKSTVLQFFDFLAQQIKGDLSGWLANRQWQVSDINSKLSPKINIEFEVFLQDDEGIQLMWSGNFNSRERRCTTEQIKWGPHLLLRVESRRYDVWELNGKKLNKIEDLSGVIAFKYQGSVLSQLREKGLPAKLTSLKEFFINVQALDLLAPELLRRRTRDSGNSLGLGGERLSAFLYEMDEARRVNIREKMMEIYPHFKEFDTLSMRSGWKRLTVHEQFKTATLKTEARHVADGILRLLAIMAQLSKEQSFLLLDEIENGINPELIEFLMDSLVTANSQILVTTHSPMVLNYLEDKIAKSGVIYLYRAHNGATKAIPFFEIPSMAEKLSVMGPGEVYEDTILTKLHQEITMLNNTTLA